MGKKRSREADGQGDIAMAEADPRAGKKAEDDDSSDDEVRTPPLPPSSPHQNKGDHKCKRSAPLSTPHG